MFHCSKYAGCAVYARLSRYLFKVPNFCTTPHCPKSLVQCCNGGFVSWFSIAQHLLQCKQAIGHTMALPVQYSCHHVNSNDCSQSSLASTNIKKQLHHVIKNNKCFELEIEKLQKHKHLTHTCLQARSHTPTRMQ